MTVHTWWSQISTSQREGSIGTHQDAEGSRIFGYSEINHGGYRDT